MRKYRNKQEWRELLASYKTSGKTVAEFCREIGIHPNTFYYRIRKTKEHESDRFVRLPITTVQTGKIKIRIQDITIEPESGYNKRELSQIIETILEVVNANVQ